jgi:hypothetical protein
MTRSATELGANSGHRLDSAIYRLSPVRHQLMVVSLHAAALRATWHAVEEKLQQDPGGSHWHLASLGDIFC